MGNTLEQVAHVVRTLEGTDNWEDGLKHILENEIRRRLNRYELADQRFRRKYSLDHAAFRKPAWSRNWATPTRPRVTFAIGKWLSAASAP